VFGLWSTTQCPPPLQRSTKLKISHWYFDQCLYPNKTSSSVRNILSKRLSTWFFTHIHLMRCFIVNCKSHCCNDTFTDVRFTLLQAKNILQEYKLFYAVRNSISLSILSTIFIQIFTFFKVMPGNKSECFFLNTVYTPECAWWFFRRFVTFLIIAPYKYSYLLTYL